MVRDEVPGALEAGAVHPRGREAEGVELLAEEIGDGAHAREIVDAAVDVDGGLEQRERVRVSASTADTIARSGADEIWAKAAKDKNHHTHRTMLEHIRSRGAADRCQRTSGASEPETAAGEAARESVSRAEGEALDLIQSLT